MPSSEIIERNHDGELLCPRCGFNYLHHGTVAVFSRDEDDVQTVETSVSHNNTTTKIVSSKDSANPSSRRGGIRITFDCEGCSSGSADDYIDLCFAQHKGNTVLSWSFSTRKHEKDIHPDM